METIGFILLIIIGIVFMIFGFGLAWLGSRFSSHTFTEIAILFTIGITGVLVLVYAYIRIALGCLWRGVAYEPPTNRQVTAHESVLRA